MEHLELFSWWSDPFPKEFLWRMLLWFSPGAGVNWSLLCSLQSAVVLNSSMSKWLACWSSCCCSLNWSWLNPQQELCDPSFEENREKKRITLVCLSSAQAWWLIEPLDSISEVLSTKLKKVQVKKGFKWLGAGRITQLSYPTANGQADTQTLEVVTNKMKQFK